MWWNYIFKIILNEVWCNKIISNKYILNLKIIKMYLKYCYVGIGSTSVKPQSASVQFHKILSPKTLKSWNWDGTDTERKPGPTTNKLKLKILLIKINKLLLQNN